MGASLALMVLRTRHAGLGALLGLAVVALALGVSVFDGEPRVDEKLDATVLAWMGAVLRRALAGVVLVVLALPMSRALSGGASGERWWVAGLVLGVLPGLALASSSLVVLDTMKHLLDDPSLPTERRILALEHALGRSELLLGAAAVVASLGGAWLAWREARRPAPT